VLFQRLRWVMFRNSLRVVIDQATVRLVTIVLISLLVWGCVFALSVEGFSFLQKQIPVSGGIVALLFDFLFLLLGVMLIFSGGLILYSSLFSSAETAFLLSLPARADQVFAYKFQTAVGFSSWAFLLLGSPVLIAYGLASGVPWYFYALLPLFFIGFVLIPGSVGALLCLLVVNGLPRQRLAVLAVTGLGLLALLLYGFYLGMHAARHGTGSDLQRLIDYLALARSDLMPSQWMRRGLMTAGRGDWTESLFFLALIWSNGLFLYVLTAGLAARLYRRGYNRLASGTAGLAAPAPPPGVARTLAGLLISPLYFLIPGRGRWRRPGGAWIDNALSATLAFLPPQTRLLIVKDFRTFRREPAQWGQVLIFLGLMVLYFVNTRQFYQADIGRPYQLGVGLLNLAVTALLLCAYTGRFIYPMLSLEGRKFWLLGLLPLKRERLLWGKFGFSATGTLLIAELCVVTSDLLLGLAPLAVGLHALAAAVLALGLSGLSVGLGACMPNFRESDPSKIAVGFGGTLNLVTGLLFLVIVISLIAGPYHVAALTGQDDLSWGTGLGWVTAAASAGTLLGAAAVVIPLRAGARTLRRMEF
jgi:ABC-2 type transport system permease protein